ncbi:MAG: tail fiber protein [bacterium]|nr:tail fiber protein [bacterium]
MMKNILKSRLYIVVLSALAALIVSVAGCEAGLTGSSESSNSSDDKFSFSEMYAKVSAIEQTNIELQNSIATLQSLLGVSEGNNQTLQEQVNTLNTIVAPVGSIVAWHKDMNIKSGASSPAVPEGWVECNGQTVSDGDSVYDGEAVPNLNGEGRFLRGSSISGTNTDDTTAVNGLNIVNGGSHTHYFDTYRVNGANYFGSGHLGHNTDLDWHQVAQSRNDGAHGHTIAGDSETSPINMSVIWIMRIK